MASMIYLGFSMFAFIFTYAIIYFTMPILFGSLFETFDVYAEKLTPEWKENYIQHRETLLFLTPLMAFLGVFIFIIKVLMNASSSGRD